MTRKGRSEKAVADKGFVIKTFLSCRKSGEHFARQIQKSFRAKFEKVLSPNSKKISRQIQKSFRC
jgi:hypothetical protein